MDDLLQAIDFWHWWLLGLALLVLEMLAPGVIFLWMGLAAGVIGFFVLVQPGMFWEWQFAGFAVFSVVFAILGRTWVKRNPIETEHPHLNRRGEQYVDRVFTLEEPIINGDGKIQVDDSTWKITGPDCPAGTRVRVVGVDGVIFQVECLSEGMN